MRHAGYRSTRSSGLHTVELVRVGLTLNETEPPTGTYLRE